MLRLLRRPTAPFPCLLLIHSAILSLYELLEFSKPSRDADLASARATAIH